MQYTSKPEGVINVGQKERAASILGGGAMLLTALAKPSRASLALAASGGYLVYRGLTGRCLFYQALGIQRAGAGTKAGIKVERTMTVARPRAEVYSFWRNFENLPTFMRHLNAVRVTGDRTSHWTARGPLGTAIDWDAEITQEREHELIAWRSLPGSEIENSGIVEFRDAPGGRGTEVRVSLRYYPPGGSASAALARVFSEEPEKQVREDLGRFKRILETSEISTVYGQTSGRYKQVEQERAEIQRGRRKDVVQQASEQSFPASDPPPWTQGGE